MEPRLGVGCASSCGKPHHPLCFGDGPRPSYAAGSRAHDHTSMPGGGIGYNALLGHIQFFTLGLDIMIQQPQFGSEDSPPKS